ncbi:MAG: HNH endonuclease [Desulfobacterales bacterium]|nr:HNH endonuclease [Desulfobacterales bacterium]
MTNILNTKKNYTCQQSTNKLSKRQKEHRAFINSPEWEEIRQRLFKSRGKQCEICGEKRGVQVHHINYDRFGGEELDTDLIILCGNHHMKAHGLRKESNLEKFLRLEHEELVGVPWCFRMEYKNAPFVKPKKKKKRKKKKKQQVKKVEFKQKIVLRKKD